MGDGLKRINCDETPFDYCEFRAYVRRLEKAMARCAAAFDDLLAWVSRSKRPGPRGRPSRERTAQADRVIIKETQPQRYQADIDGVLFHLPPSLACLLEVLAADRGDAQPDDVLVGWKPDAEVRQLLKKREGRSVSPRALIQRIHKLRELLRKSGLNDDLVQTHRERGWRFAVRRAVVAGLSTTGQTREVMT